MAHPHTTMVVSGGLDDPGPWRYQDRTRAEGAGSGSAKTVVAPRCHPQSLSTAADGVSVLMRLPQAPHVHPMGRVL